MSESRTIAEHFAAIMAHARPVPAQEEPSLAPVNQDLLGRVLSEDATAQLPIPPFSNTSMDGFLVRSADVYPGCTLPVVGDVPAGAAPQMVPEGKAVRIMTGAPVPEDAVDAANADAGGLQIIPVEATNIPAGPHPLPEEVTINEVSARPNIRFQGEDLRPGDQVAPAGTLVDAAVLASLLSSGVQQVRVHRPVRAAIIASGDELVDLELPAAAAGDAGAHDRLPAPQLAPGQLPDSNGPMLEALIRSQVPGAVISRRHAGDTTAEFAALMDELTATHDLIITSGGVSAGAFDVVHDTLTDHAAASAGGERPDEAWFGHVLQKPGSPQGLSTWDGTPVISLPGNPVAAFISFHIYVSPFLQRLRGLPAQPDVWERPRLRTQVAQTFPGPPKPGHIGMVPAHVSFADGGFTSTPYAPHLGSHLVGSLAGTTGFVRVGDEGVPSGVEADVYFI